MSQNNVIAGALALGFLLFITLRGELPDYLRLFKPQKHPSTPAAQFTSGGGSGGSSGSSGGGSGDVVKTAMDAAEIAAMFA